MELDIDQCEKMIDKNVRTILGKDAEREAAKFLDKVEDVNALLQELMSKDQDKVRLFTKPSRRSPREPVFFVHRKWTVSQEISPNMSKVLTNLT